MQVQVYDCLDGEHVIALLDKFALLAFPLVEELAQYDDEGRLQQNVARHRSQ